VRGFFTAVVRKKLGLNLMSEKSGEERVCRIVGKPTPRKSKSRRKAACSPRAPDQGRPGARTALDGLIYPDQSCCKFPNWRSRTSIICRGSTLLLLDDPWSSARRNFGGVNSLCHIPKMVS
jgi:hypothetical protein